jgi:hypothetical protein
MLRFDGLLIAKQSWSGLLQNDAGHACAIRAANLDFQRRIANFGAGNGSCSDPTEYSTGFFQGSRLAERSCPAR